MKTLYAARRAALLAHLGKGEAAGLAVLLRLRDGTDDRALGRAALARGIAPVPLSMWHARRGSRRAGLLLGVTNVTDARLASSCEQLRAVLSMM